MLKVKVIATGTLSEPYWRGACEEYKKRLSGSVALNEIQLKEEKLPQNPSESEIRKALEAEADAVQTHNAQDAIKSAWGVDVDVDGNGNISLR